jgi:hypothetical protein
MIATNHVWFLIIEGTFNPNYRIFLGFDGPSLILILVFGVSKKNSFCSFLTKLKFGPILSSLHITKHNFFDLVLICSTDPHNSNKCYVYEVVHMHVENQTLLKK